MIFPTLREYKVIMKTRQIGTKIKFTNHNPYDIRGSADMARKRYPNLRLVKIAFDRTIILEDCFP